MNEVFANWLISCVMHFCMYAVDDNCFEVKVYDHVGLMQVRCYDRSRMGLTPGLEKYLKSNCAIYWCLNVVSIQPQTRYLTIVGYDRRFNQVNTRSFNMNDLLINQVVLDLKEMRVM